VTDYPADGDEWFDVEQAAVKLKVAPRTVLRYINQGRLVSIRHCNKRWVEQGAIDDFYAQLRAEAAKEASTRRRRNRPPRRSRGGDDG
jgi:predicted site-specific integrase-resolvase